MCDDDRYAMPFGVLNSITGAPGASKAAADSCFQLQGPCPVPAAGTPTAAYIAGQVRARRTDYF